MRFYWMIILSLVSCKLSAQIEISPTIYEGRDHFMVTTPGAVYYYDRAGGGLSRMIDPDGKDWIAFKKEPWDTYPASAASSYRGIPNLVFRSEDGGAGHPGHDQCVSERVDDHTIRTVSKSGRWQWTWQFFDHYAQVNIQKVDPEQNYWFLYEGTPGGEFAPSKQYYGTDLGGPQQDQIDYYTGQQFFDHYRWAYFGHKASARILYLAQLHPDKYSDTFSYLGNTESGLQSDDGMVVFGFGRAEGAQPLLKNPNTFLLGFYEKQIIYRQDHRRFAKLIRRRLRAKRN